MTEKKKETVNQRDERLVRESLTGNERSFMQLIDFYKDMVFNLCFRILGDYDDADDCAQEVFIRLYNNIGKFEFRSSLSTWIYRITVNTCRTHMKSEKFSRMKKMLSIDQKNGEESAAGMEISDCSFEPEKEFMTNEMSREIQKALNRLPEELRILIILREIEGKSYDEIKTITGLRTGTLKSRLNRARRNIRTELTGVIK